MKIIENMSAEEYNNAPGIRSSLLKVIDKSPAHANDSLVNPPSQTAAMRFGTAFHCFILEPQKFADQYSVFEGDRRTKEGKDKYEEIIASGRLVLSLDDYDTITAMASAIGNDADASALLRDPAGKAEVSVFWEDDYTGLKCKCRPDLWVGDTLYDIKSTLDASPIGFPHEVKKFGYGLSAVHYMAGTQAKRFIFIAVEKKAPYAVALYELDALSLDYCARKRESLMDYWRDCLVTRRYPAYSSGVQVISLPNYLLTQEIEE